MPTPTEYIRPITVNPDLAALQAAIEADATVTPRTLDAIAFERGHTGYQVRLTTDDVLTDPAQTDALDAVIAAHAGRIYPSSPVIMAALPAGVPPGDIAAVDYKAGVVSRLHRKVKTRFRGELREVEYYLDDTEADLVLLVQIYADAAMTTLGYDRTGNGLAIQRWTKRTWYNTGGSLAAVKLSHKRYSHDPVEQMVEGEKRRRNVMRALTIDVLNMLVVTTAADPTAPTAQEIADAETDGSTFIESYADEVSTYFRTGDVSWKGTPGVGNDATAWLDTLTDAHADPVVQAIAASFGWSGDIRTNIQAQLVEIYA